MSLPGLTGRGAGASGRRRNRSVTVPTRVDGCFYWLARLWSPIHEFMHTSSTASCPSSGPLPLTRATHLCAPPRVTDLCSIGDPDLDRRGDNREECRLSNGNTNSESPMQIPIAVIRLYEHQTLRASGFTMFSCRVVAAESSSGCLRRTFAHLSAPGHGGDTRSSKASSFFFINLDRNPNV